MALDGMFLYQLRHELAQKALDARVDRIHQPTREEIILALRWKGGAGKLLISANASSPRIHFTEAAPENPKQPPMFCMLLRKQIGGGKVVEVCQPGMERVIEFYIEYSAMLLPVLPCRASLQAVIIVQKTDFRYRRAGKQLKIDFNLSEVSFSTKRIDSKDSRWNLCYSADTL